MRVAVLPTRDAVLLPGAVNELNVGRPGSVAAIRHAVAREEPVLVLLQRKIDVDDPGASDLYEVGSLCRITDAERSSAEAARVRVAAIERVKVLKLERSGDALFAEVEVLRWKPAEPPLPDSLRESLPFLIEIALGERKPAFSQVERLCFLSVVTPIEPAVLQRVLEQEDLQPVAVALASLRDQSWLARFLRWIRAW